MASFNSQTDDGDDEFITRELQEAPSVLVPSVDDGSDVDLETGEVRINTTRARASGDTVSRPGGGWAYSVGRLLQSVLFAHYLRCAGEFARAVIYAVGFALGAKAGPESDGRGSNIAVHWFLGVVVTLSSQHILFFLAKPPFGMPNGISVIKEF